MSSRAMLAFVALGFGACALLVVAFIVTGDPGVPVSPSAKMECDVAVIDEVDRACVGLTAAKLLSTDGGGQEWLGHLGQFGDGVTVGVQLERHVIAIGAYPEKESAERFESEDPKRREHLRAFATELIHACADGGAQVSCFSWYREGRREIDW